MPSADPWLVVGLGNPGPTYAWTRHNVGFMAVDEIANQLSAGFKTARGYRADVAETTILVQDETQGFHRARIVLVKPLTYMNESGQAVGKLSRFYRIPANQIIVIHDELDLDLGRLKLKIGGGDNGHNGLKSVRAHLGTGDFYRVRIGIGRPPGRQTGADYVLAKIPSSLREDVETATNLAADATQKLITAGLSTAQNFFNR